MNLDDPKLTAYALGELEKEDRAAIEQLLSASPEARRVAVETGQLAEQLKQGFRKELDSVQEEPRNVLPLPYGRLFWSEGQRSALAIAAALVAFAAITAVVLWRNGSPGPEQVRAVNSPSSSAPDFAVEAEASGEEPASIGDTRGETENSFIATSEKAISVIPIGVGKASYPKVRGLIASGVRPPRDAIRIEEMINAFTYDYPDPEEPGLASLVIDAAPCPWAAGHLLVRIGVKSRNIDAAQNLARNGEIEVNFNAARIQSYRLLGYDPGHSSGSGGVAAGTGVGAGNAVTALYEVMPEPNQADRGEGQPLLVRLRCRESPPLAEQRLMRPFASFSDAPADFRFAAAVAEFAMILRHSPYKGSANLESVIQWATMATTQDHKDERGAFVECARQAQSLAL